MISNVQCKYDQQWMNTNERQVIPEISFYRGLQCKKNIAINPKIDFFIIPNPVKICSYQNTLDIKEHTIVSYDASDSNEFKTIVIFSCRGLETVDFDPNDGWQVQGFDENDDSEGDSENNLQRVMSFVLKINA